MGMRSCEKHRSWQKDDIKQLEGVQWMEYLAPVVIFHIKFSSVLFRTQQQQPRTLILISLLFCINLEIAVKFSFSSLFIQCICSYKVPAWKKVWTFLSLSLLNILSVTFTYQPCAVAQILCFFSCLVHTSYVPSANFIMVLDF